MSEQTYFRERSESLMAMDSGIFPEILEPALDYEETARLAYSYWEARGGEGGTAEDDWYRAEAALRSRAAAGNEAAFAPVGMTAAAGTA